MCKVKIRPHFAVRFQPGATIYVNGSYLGRYNDTPGAGKLTIDVYDPSGLGGENFGVTLPPGGYIITDHP
jgi:hypothetical protein